MTTTAFASDRPPAVVPALASRVPRPANKNIWWVSVVFISVVGCLPPLKNLAKWVNGSLKDIASESWTKNAPRYWHLCKFVEFAQLYSQACTVNSIII
jgi:hypothetical protein